MHFTFKIKPVRSRTDDSGGLVKMATGHGFADYMLFVEGKAAA
jgi:hypothetical protein